MHNQSRDAADRQCSQPSANADFGYAGRCQGRYRHKNINRFRDAWLDKGRHSYDSAGKGRKKSFNYVGDVVNKRHKVSQPFDGVEDSGGSQSIGRTQPCHTGRQFSNAEAAQGQVTIGGQSQQEQRQEHPHTGR